MRPKFYRLENKIAARRELVRIYREMTGNDTIPKQYWTLSGPQTARQSEIRQMCSLGLIQESQFHGVDFDRRVIAANKAAFPRAHWHTGDWLDIIGHRNFLPSLVYLDTMNVTGMRPAKEIVNGTIRKCPQGTVLFINVMLNNPRNMYSKIPTDESILNDIESGVPPCILRRWDLLPEHYVYSATNITKMATYTLRRVS